MCNAWDDLKEQYKALKGQTYSILNSSTGKFLCDSQGEQKIFHDLSEAKAYIRTKNLSSLYCIHPNEE